MTPNDDLYPCVGICMVDPDSGFCLGCGRPPLVSPPVVAEAVPAVLTPHNKNAETSQPE
jgi:hypothetical protein